jgi:hypothetical protein
MNLSISALARATLRVALTWAFMTASPQPRPHPPAPSPKGEGEKGKEGEFCSLPFREAGVGLLITIKKGRRLATDDIRRKKN